MSNAVKQSVGGFKVVNYGLKGKNGEEKVRLVLEANVEDVSAAECDMGSILKALLDHKVGDTEIGLSLFVTK